MGNIRYKIALLMAKLSVIALKITKHNGTNFPGTVALKICPDFLKYVPKPDRIIAITGTNGKTTVSNMLNDILTKQGIKVLNNGLGSNINSGIATCLISGTPLFGKGDYDLAVLEIDERSALRVFPYVEPNLMIVTNLSRDSIMRNAHPEYIADILTKYIPPKTKLILNADDLLSCGVAPNNDRVYFGIDRMEGDATECTNLINDIQVCPECHTKLKYEYLRYSNIGKAFCPSCGYKAPEYDYRAFDVDKDQMMMRFEGKGETADVKLVNDSTFNIYNEIALVSVLFEMGYTAAQIASMINRTEIVRSRFDRDDINGKSVTMLLAKDKNAYACSRVFEYIASQDGDKELILMMNSLGDSKHWSENTCWLYDCDFELLNKENIRNIVVTGPRAKDYRFRLLTAGISEDRITYCEKETDTPEALKYFDNDNIYILYGTDSITLASGIRSNISKNIQGGK